MRVIPDINVVRLTAEAEGERLDRYVAESRPEISRTQAQKLIDEGRVTVNGQKTKPGLKLSAGDTVEITLPEALPESPQAEAIPIDIVYEDDDVLVINKPSGLTVHPAPGHPGHTLLNAVMTHVPELPETDDARRPGIVHRLDKNASGLMVIAKNEAAQANLVSQFKARAVVKAYVVMVKGRLTPADGIIEAPIGRDARNRKRMAVVEAGKGKEARTRYHVSRYVGDNTLLEISMETGRTHQIRVHLSAIGYPVLGDKVYGVKSEHIPRLFLHACRLGFRLPASGEYQEFTTGLPPDLKRALSDLT